MNLLDAAVVVVAVVAGVGGYRLGFFARVLSWVGLGLGLYLAVRYLPDLVRAVNLRSADARLGVVMVFLVGAAFVGQAAGMLLGGRLHAVLPLGPLRTVDRGVGAAVGVGGVVIALWLLLPSLASVTGWPARESRQSVISRWVANDLPAPPNALQSLRNIVGDEGFPEVFASLRPSETVGPPPGQNPLGAALTARVAASSVKVEGQACDRLVDGSGFAVAADVVLTNAHVVAGEPAGATSVITPTGRRLAATVVLYDPDRDLALLRVPGLQEIPLPLTDGHVGQAGAVFGHPNGQADLAVQPATVAQEITAVGEDLYNRHHTARDVYVLAADLYPGDSGGALVDRAGGVVGVAFAIASDRSGTAYALTTAEVRPDLTGASATAVSTQACVSG